MRPQRLYNNLADRKARIDGRGIVLKDHADLPPPAFIAAAVNGAAFKQHFALIGRLNANQHPAQRAFAAAAFTDDRQNLSFI